jgi:hypothetical protein
MLKDKREMDGSFLEFLLKHIVYRTPEQIRCQYHVATNWMARALQLKLEMRGATWSSISTWVSRWIRSNTNLENTLVVPFNDQGHWSLVIVEMSKTFHLDQLLGYHIGKVLKYFVFLLHLGWAVVKGLLPGSREWKDLVYRKIDTVHIPSQKNFWECGYVVCMHFWHYILLRGSRKESNKGILFSHKKWLPWDDPVQYHRWFLHALYTETKFLDPTLGNPIIRTAWTEESVVPVGDSSDEELRTIEECESRPLQERAQSGMLSDVLKKKDLSAMCVQKRALNTSPKVGKDDRSKRGNKLRQG